MLFNRFHKIFEVLRSLWPQFVKRLTNRAARLRAQGNLNEAVAILDEAIRLDSRMAVAFAQRCACYYDLGDYAKALEDANQAVALAPKEADSYRWRAHAADALGQCELAVSDLTEVLRLDPKDSWLYYERGRAQCGLGDFRAALADAERFLAKCPDEALGHQALASARDHLHETDAALAAIDEAVRLEPNNGEFQFFRARLLWELGRLEEASAEYEAALGQPCMERGEWRDMAIMDRHWLAGQIAQKNGDYREAIRQYDAALKVIEQSDESQESIHRPARLYYDRALAWHLLSEYENALRDLDEAVRLKPKTVTFLDFRAGLLLESGRFEEALAGYEAVLAQDPESTEDWRTRAIVRRDWLSGSIVMKQGNLEEAIERLDAAVEAIERAEEALESDQTLARMYNERGEAWYLLREYEHSLLDFGKAIEFHPDHPVYYINRANAYWRLRRHAEADRDFVEAVRRGPDCADSYAYLAWFKVACLEAEFRNTEQAVAMAHKAVELDESSSRYYGILATTYAAEGDFDEAVRWQTEFLATMPDDTPDEKRSELEEVLEKYRAEIPLPTSWPEDPES